MTGEEKMPSQAEHALHRFDAAGEAAALRYVIDHATPVPYRRGTSFLLPDGSTVARLREKRGYEFSWPGGQATRNEQSKTLFPWPDSNAVIHSMMQAIEKRITPEGQELPSRGDDPFVSPEEALSICPELEERAESEIAAMEPPEDLWETMDELAQRTAGNLERTITKESLTKLERLSAIRRAECRLARQTRRPA